MTRARWTALALAILAVGVYANAAGNGFALDDEYILVGNEQVREPGSLAELFTTPYWPDSPGRLGLYRPLTTTTYAVEWRVWGDNPVAYHMTNLALHAAVTLLVFGLLQTLLGLPGAAAGAAVFAVHPVHVEAAANVVGRAELLAAVFVLAAALIYARAGLTRSRARLWGGAAGIAAAYSLGLLSKEIAVTLPGLLLVLESGRGWGRGDAVDAGQGRGRDRGPGIGARVVRVWPVYAAVALVASGYLAVRSAVLGATVGNDAASFFAPLGPVERVMTAVATWPEYLRLMVYPYELIADYSPAVLMPVNAFGLRVAAGLLTGGLAVAVAAIGWRRARPVALGVLWFAIAVFPVSNLVIPIGVLLAERTLYLPSVGLALIVGGASWAVWQARPRWRRGGAVALAAVVVLASARTWTRTPVWKSTDTVIESLVSNHPESFRSQWFIADQLRQQGHLASALGHYRTAVGLMPGHYQLRIQFGQALLRAGQVTGAVASFRIARNAVPELPEAHAFLMVALLRAGEVDAAVDAGSRGLEWHPDHRGIHHQLAIALTHAEDFSAALNARRESLRLAGQRAAPLQHVHQAELLLRTGSPEAARAALARARERAPDPASIPTLAALREAITTANPAVLPYR